MSIISITDTATAGFRFIRQRPKVVAMWAALFCAQAFVTAFLMVSTMGSAITAFRHAQAAGDRVASSGQYSAIWPLFIVLMLVGLAVIAIVATTICRATLRQEDEGFAYIRVGGDEVRQFLLTLLTTLVVGGLYFVLALVAAIAGVFAWMALPRGVAIVTIGVVVLAAVAALAYISVRLSLATALTFERRKVDLFGSWKLSRGRVWTLVGICLLTWLLSALVGLGFLIVQAVVAFGFGGMAGITRLSQPDMSTLGAYFTIGQIAILLIGAAASAVIYPIFLIPAVEAYRQITREQAHL